MADRLATGMCVKIYSYMSGRWNIGIAYMSVYTYLSCWRPCRPGRAIYLVGTRYVTAAATCNDSTFLEVDATIELINIQNLVYVIAAAAAAGWLVIAMLLLGRYGICAL